MSSRCNFLASSLALALFAASARAQIDQHASQRFFSPQPEGGDWFGRALALDGTTLAVGAPGDGSGEVSIYSYAGGSWQFDAQLTGVGLDSAAQFGAALALQGDRLVVGAPLEHFGSAFSPGTVFLFERSAGVWSLTAQLVSGSSDLSQAFGQAVALDGDRLVVGASGVGMAGAVFVFEAVAGTWTKTATLVPSDAWINYQFGASVGLHGDEIVVGAPNRQLVSTGAYEGAVYSFSLGATGWQEDQILVDTLAPTNYRASTLGSTLAFDGQTIVAGAAPYTLSTYGGQGAVVFERSAGAWAPFQRLTSSLSWDAGSAVALEGDTIVVGARNSYWQTNSPQVGVATVWKREASGWSERWRELDSPPTPYSHFGAAVALSNGRLAIGSPSAPWNLHTQAGVVSTFEVRATVGELLCFGDGFGVQCPCGKNAIASHGPGCESSRGYGAVLLASGSASIAADDLALTGAQLIPGGTAVLAYRAGASNGGLGVPLHDGLLCLSGPGGRLGVRSAPSYPWMATWGPSIASQVQASAGATTYFQVWYRDPQGACGGASNLTNALKVTFTP